MVENTKIPAIRFAGFTEAWEQRKLSEMSSLITKGTTPLDKSNTGNVNFVKIESIDEASGEITITKKITNEEHEGYLRRSQLKENDILFSIAGTLGRVTSVKSNILPANTNQALAIIRRKTGDLQYVKTYLKGKVVSDYIKKNPTIGAQPNLSLEQVGNLEIALPILDEQKKIGEYFSELDNLITLHQRKYEKLSNVKKSMLEKMFPKNDSNVPEIRFKGFTEAWEQRKAKELCNIGTGGSNTQDQVEDGIYPFYIRSDIPVKSNKYLYDCEAVITIGDGNIGRVFHYVNGKFDLHQRCYKMTDFQNVLGKYFYYFFSTRFYDRAMKMTAKATVDSVRLEMISEMDILKPTEINEQKKIADFFTHLDNLITLHQHKLEKLKNIKKSMLEKMFI